MARVGWGGVEWGWGFARYVCSAVRCAVCVWLSRAVHADLPHTHAHTACGASVFRLWERMHRGRCGLHGGWRFGTVQCCLAGQPHACIYIGKCSASAGGTHSRRAASATSPHAQHSGGRGHADLGCCCCICHICRPGCGFKPSARFLQSGSGTLVLGSGHDGDSDDDSCRTRPCPSHRRTHLKASVSTPCQPTKNMYGRSSELAVWLARYSSWLWLGPRVGAGTSASAISAVDAKLLELLLPLCAS